VELRFADADRAHAGLLLDGVGLVQQSAGGGCEVAVQVRHRTVASAALTRGRDEAAQEVEVVIEGFGALAKRIARGLALQQQRGVAGSEDLDR